MKKLVGLLGIIFLMIIAIGCDNREKLYVLNWYEYINDDVVEKFEKEFNVKVVIDPVTTNESMYNKIETKAAKYDIVIPSDYMVQRMYKENMLLELDFSKIPNYSVDIFDPKLQILRDTYFQQYQDYSIPYFWGTLAIMYNKNKAGVKELVEEHEWSIFFDKNLVPANVSVGMYDSSRDAMAAAFFSLGKSPNPTKVEDLDEIEPLITNYKYNVWGTDNLKEMVSTGNLDIALVYSGDFFDMMFYALDIGETPKFDMHVPTGINNVWYDTIAIPITSTKIDLAHEFINFLLDFDNAYENASFIGYCPVRYDVYQAILENDELGEIVSHPGYYPGNVVGAEVYLTIENNIAEKMDNILTKARNK